jgi:hypothetical protein
MKKEITEKLRKRFLGAIQSRETQLDGFFALLKHRTMRGK